MSTLDQTTSSNDGIKKQSQPNKSRDCNCFEEASNNSIDQQLIGTSDNQMQHVHFSYSQKSALPTVKGVVNHSRSENLRSKNHIALAKELLKIGDHFLVTQPDLAKRIGVELQSVRRALKKFKEHGFCKYRAVKDEFGKLCTEIEILNSTVYDFSNSVDQYPERVRSIDRDASSLDREIDTISLYQESGFTPNDFATFWPTVFNLGFGPEQTEQVVKARSKVGKETNYLSVSLDYIEWQLVNEGIKSKKDGKPVGAGYLFQSLKKGPWTKPSGYLSSEELAKEEQLQKLKRLAEMEERAATLRQQVEEAKENEAFQRWKDSLSQEDVAEYIGEWRQKKSHLPANEERILKLKWGKIGNDIHSNP